ncbi:hypothetical protein IF2G_02453 [Cordyceps javanica]|nr:hypothetical protein IF2G_02453 [Cordyceps javanica]
MSIGNTTTNAITTEPLSALSLFDPFLLQDGFQYTCLLFLRSFLSRQSPVSLLPTASIAYASAHRVYHTHGARLPASPLSPSF